MSHRLRHLLALAGACSALVLGACGSSEEPEGDPLPAASVSDIENRLDEIQRRYDDAVEDGNLGACNQINSNSLKAIREIIAGLPEGVDADLRDALEKSFARLGNLADEECADIEPPEAEPAPAPAPEPEPEPAPEETVPEETPTVPAEPEPEEKKEKKEKPDKGSGGAPAPENGNSNGGGVEAPGLEGGG